jgi:hypothetical protein
MTWVKILKLVMYSYFGVVQYYYAVVGGRDFGGIYTELTLGSAVNLTEQLINMIINLRVLIVVHIIIGN